MQQPVRYSNKSRKFKVQNSWGVYDVYKHIRKNHWYDIGRPLKEQEFYAIIRGINNLLAENIANGITVKFPHKMGRLELRKYEAGVKFVDGKLKITYPVDWGNTLKLWEEDEEASRNKTLIRYERKWTYRVIYAKPYAKYNNRGFYKFVLNRFVKRALSDNIKKGKTDTIW